MIQLGKCHFSDQPHEEGTYHLGVVPVRKATKTKPALTADATCLFWRPVEEASS